jgi:sugar phosphate isomerase/epimerase
MKISLGSWAFSFGPFAANPIPFDKTVKRLSEAGYDGIEICGFPPHVTQDKYPTTESRKGAQLIADATILDGYNSANFGTCSENAGLQLGTSSISCP